MWKLELGALLLKYSNARVETYGEFDMLYQEQGFSPAQLYYL